MVQMDEVAKIRQRWIDAGRPECPHLNLDQEFYLGARTDDYVCMSCGELFSRREARSMREAAKDPGAVSGPSESGQC
ncbi:hypothetical protein AB0I99_00625 [Streptomyces spongiicola]|uniref:hypothetical protein n=1 Tax=Streptomyces spongiicola TaxID=1690221 RepID=UPI0033EC014E